MKTLLPILLLAFTFTAQAVETITLPVKQTDYEKVWKAALVAKLRADKIGKVLSEMRVEFGRVDITTGKEVIEVDRHHKFHQGIGQALHYAWATGKKPVVALMLDTEKIDPKKTAFIEKLCKHHKIRLVLLRAEK